MSKQIETETDDETVGETSHPFAPLGADDEEAAPAETSAKPAAPLFRGINKEFASVEELTQYVTELERKQIEQEAKLSTYESVAPRLGASSASTGGPDDAPPQEVDLNSKYAERLFSEPAKVLQELREEIEASIEKKHQKTTEEKQFWNTFYEEFSDLNGLDDIVQLQLHKNREQWRKLPMATARKLLAHEARSAVAMIRERATPTETLPSGSAVTAGATRGSGPAVAETSKAPTSFVDQVRRLNKRYPQAG